MKRVEYHSTSLHIVLSFGDQSTETNDQLLQQVIDELVTKLAACTESNGEQQITFDSSTVEPYRLPAHGRVAIRIEEIKLTTNLSRRAVHEIIMDTIAANIRGAGV